MHPHSSQARTPRLRRPSSSCTWTFMARGGNMEMLKDKLSMNAQTSPAECQRKCASDSQCVAISYLGGRDTVECFFYSDCTKSVQSRLKKNTENPKFQQKLILKTHSRSRPWKRLRPKGVKPLKLMTLTHFQLFLNRPRAPEKKSKWKPK